MTTENLINSLRDQAEPHGNCLLSRAANELERMMTSPEEMMILWWVTAEVPTKEEPIAEGDWVIERSHEGSWGLFRAYRAIDGSYMSESLRVVTRRKRPEGAEDVEAVLPDVFEGTPFTREEIADTIARRMDDQGFKIVRTRP